MCRQANCIVIQGDRNLKNMQVAVHKSQHIASKEINELELEYREEIQRSVATDGLEQLEKKLGHMQDLTLRLPLAPRRMRREDYFNAFSDFLLA